jgi:glycerol-3-phosphate dehydrogenase
LPWLGRTLAGTTDSNTSITMLPEPNEDEIQFILDAISDYLNVQVFSCILSIYIWSRNW